MLTGLQLGVGALGGLITTAPLAFANAAIGGRVSFAVMAALTAIVAVLVLALIRNDRDHRPADAPVEHWPLPCRAWPKPGAVRTRAACSSSTYRLFEL